ncbi:hypothetical protein EYF80_035188 [Liparis tanakae]|uniref:Uncharacterized protein n=1 Tax=Liparis tanakae TaxID=230148 RepID=A0A4Z2GM85_9TELE|nr:hypothetical protein EYF80_035188 [Liparis tanakae]
MNNRAGRIIAYADCSSYENTAIQEEEMPGHDSRLELQGEMYVPASSGSTSLMRRPCCSTRKRVQPLWMLRPSLVHMMSGGGSPSTGHGSFMVRPRRTLCRWATRSDTLGGPGGAWEREGRVIKMME